MRLRAPRCVRRRPTPHQALRRVYHHLTPRQDTRELTPSRAILQLTTLPQRLERRNTRNDRKKRNEHARRAAQSAPANNRPKSQSCPSWPWGHCHCQRHHLLQRKHHRLDPSGSRPGNFQTDNCRASRTCARAKRRDKRERRKLTKHEQSKGLVR